LWNYFREWKIKVNASKTQAAYFTACWSLLKLPRPKHNKPKKPYVVNMLCLGLGNFLVLELFSFETLDLGRKIHHKKNDKNPSADGVV
jgi:hypothetical protein